MDAGFQIAQRGNDFHTEVADVIPFPDERGRRMRAERTRCVWCGRTGASSRLIRKHYEPAHAICVQELDAYLESIR